MNATRNIATYVETYNIDIKKMSKATGIQYEALYDSLRNNKRSRPLRADEFMSVCSYLYKDPHDFMAVPFGIILMGRKYKQIDVIIEDELMASIGGDGTLVEKDGVTVVCVPFDA